MKNIAINKKLATLVFALCAGALYGLFPYVTNAATLNFSSGSSQVTVNDTFTVNITLDSEGQGVYGADVNVIRFNPSLLQVVDADGATSGVQIQPGSLMPFTISNSVNNSLGTIQFSQIAMPGSTFNGTGILATINFRAIASGTANLTIDFTVGGTTDSNIAGQGSDLLTAVGSKQIIIIPADTSAPIISGVAVSNITQNSATISWTTNENSDTQVEYGLTSAYGSVSTLNTSPVTSHSVNLTSLSAGTTYNFRVRSSDAAGNISFSSNSTFVTVTPPDTTVPSTPANLSASVVSTSQVNLSWSASTDNVGVTNYRVYRCQGTSCTATTEIGNVTGTSYSDSGLSASTAYRYRVRAQDAAGNLSSYSSAVTATTQTPVNNKPTGSLDGVNGLNQIFGWSQDPDNTSAANQVHIYIDINAGQPGAVAIPVTAGDFRSDVGNHAFNYNIPSEYINNQPHQYWAWGIDLTDPANNNQLLPGSPRTFTIAPPATLPVISSFTASPSAITTGDSTTLSWSVSGSPAPTLSINQGVGTVTGISKSVSPTITTTYTLTATNAAGSVSSNVTVTVNPAIDTTAPSVPASVSASALSVSQINLTWSASTDNVGVSGYRVYRCQGSGCTATVEIANVTSGTSYQDSGLTASTIYNYRVRAYDAAANLSAFSASASATTQASPDTIAPSVPSGLTATSTIISQVRLNWNASTDTGGSGLAGYKVFRCIGSGCTPTAQIATTTALTYVDTGTLSNIIYRYHISAYDNAGNVSSASAVASATGRVLKRKIVLNLESISSNKVVSGKVVVLNTQDTIISEVQFTTDSTGQVEVILPDGLPTLASIRVAVLGFLPRKLNNVDLSDGSVVDVIFPALLGGEFNDDSIINSLDFSIMNTKWQTTDALVDLNRDAQVNSLDFSYLSKNWLQTGE